MTQIATITFQTEHGPREVEAAPGELITDVAIRGGVPLAMPCGNQGRCGRCMVRVTSGDVRRRENAYLDPDRAAEGWALACQSHVVGDASVVVPRRRLEVMPTKTTRRSALRAEPMAPVAAAVRKVALGLPPATLDDPTDDWSRVRRGLATEGVEASLDLGALRELARSLRSASWNVTAVLSAEPDGRPSHLLGLEPGDTTGRLFGMAVDIGTTTVVVALVDLRTGRALGTHGEYNDQIACGEDVISRIIYSRQAGGANLGRLQTLAVETINRIVAELCRRNDVSPSEIVDVVVAGNTTMTHLFLGLDPQHIRTEPYVPTANHYPTIQAGEAGLTVHPRAAVWVYPTVAAFVGGDITAGVISSGLFRTDKLTLFMDVGTNGELVLGNSDWLVTCACSAGPAFEGAGVRSGMRATAGAVEEVTISNLTLEPTLRVIGEEKARGICGSGMIGALAELFVTGIVDKQGKIDVERVRARAKRPQRVRVGEHGSEYVLAFAGEDADGVDVTLDEVDIDNLVRTKGAIYAGITSLVNSVGVSLGDVEQVLIGGSFGQHIDVEEAIRIGLLPDLPWERYRFLGNTSLLGAYQALISREVREWASEVAGKMTYLELIADTSFSQEYTSAMFLPHTDLDAFPSVKKVLAGTAGT